LDEDEATPERCEKIYDYFWKCIASPGMFGFTGFQFGIGRKVANRISRYIRLIRRIQVTMIHKNPRNTFRIPFLRAVFPDARFVFVFRDGRANVSSLMEGWGHTRFHSFMVPVRDDSGKETMRQWAFELPPKWRKWTGRSVPEVCAHLWVAYNEFMLDCEKTLPKSDTARVRYEDLVADTGSEIRRLCRTLDLPLSRALLKIAKAPPAISSVSEPRQGKWREKQAEIEHVRPILQPMMDRLGYQWDE
jgi:hypothetical protein